ncbi:MAG: Tim44 domain-containing protein [Mesorhizobium sp.]|nr:Tim44 domain-containing protein [Mesorhizobium sp.]MCO5161079.1 Tim44 domain-containing protein [Mesorhizobium sp.]
MPRSGRIRFVALFMSLFVGLTLVSTDFAEARRGGSFGSRGTRTWQAPAPTRTAPSPTGPVERSMTPAQSPNAATRQQQTVGQQRPGMFSGFGGSLMRGLLIGGLFGMLLGYGFGGLAGALGFLVQLLLIGLLVSVALAWFRSRREPAAAGGAPYGGGNDFGHARTDASDAKPHAGGFTIPSIGGGAAAPATQDIQLDKADLDTFERRLAEVQKAFSDEDHSALRRLSTPEMVSYFSEELADNAKRGLRNEVRDVHLVSADISEAWREGDTDYATAAFGYESVDLMRDRATGKVVEGDERLTETTELWTFVRPRGGEWKLSAIQEA